MRRREFIRRSAVRRPCHLCLGRSPRARSGSRVFFQHIELAMKRVQLFMDALPNMQAATVFWDAASADQWRATQEAAKQLSLRLAGIELRDPPMTMSERSRIRHPIIAAASLRRRRHSCLSIGSDSRTLRFHRSNCLGVERSYIALGSFAISCLSLMMSFLTFRRGKTARQTIPQVRTTKVPSRNKHACSPCGSMFGAPSADPGIRR
jgi:hypothetical protein